MLVRLKWDVSHFRPNADIATLRTRKKNQPRKQIKKGGVVILQLIRNYLSKNALFKKNITFSV